MFDVTEGETEAKRGDNSVGVQRATARLDGSSVPLHGAA